MVISNGYNKQGHNGYGLKQAEFYLFLAVWAVIWFIGLGFELILKVMGLAYWFSLTGMELIILRNVGFGLLALAIWSLFKQRSLRLGYAKHFWQKMKLERAQLIFIAIFLGLTLSYFAMLYIGHFDVGRPVFFNLLFPLKMLTYVFFQQMTITLLLFDICCKYFPEKKATIFTVLAFGSTHLFVAVNVGFFWALILTILAGSSMLFWLITRKKTASLRLPILTHYFFWVIIGCQLPLFG